MGVQEIASATGVTKPTLYHFFGGKQGLLEALFSEYASELDREIAEVAVYEGDLPRTLDRIAAAYDCVAPIGRRVLTGLARSLVRCLREANVLRTSEIEHPVQCDPAPGMPSV